MIRFCVAAGCLFLALIAHAAPSFETKFVSSPGQAPSVHAATAVELPDTTLLSCWYAGTRELAFDVQVLCSELSPGAAQWGAPRIVVRRNETAKGNLFHNFSLGNPVLYLDPAHGLWLFYGASSVIKGWSLGHVEYKFSSDLGKTWGPARRFSGLGTMVRSKPFRLDSERILLPMYTELVKRQGAICELRLQEGRILEKGCFRIPGSGHIQPSLVRDEKGVLLAYLRVKPGRPVLVSEILPDRHQARPPVATNVPNPDSAVEVVETEWGTLIVCNNDPQLRTPLSLLISEGPVRFREIFRLEEAQGTQFAYPTALRTSDGNFHIFYTYDGRSAIKQVTFNAEWLRARIEALPE